MVSSAPWNLAVLAATSVQDDEGAIVTAGAQSLQEGRVRIERFDVDAETHQRLVHRTSALERDLALGGLSAHQ
jgi:hypothetical protein